MVALHEVHVVLHVTLAIEPLRDVANLLPTTKSRVELDGGMDW